MEWLLAGAMLVAVVCSAAALAQDRRARSDLCRHIVDLAGPHGCGSPEASVGAETERERERERERESQARSGDVPQGRRAVLAQRLDVVARKLDERWAREDAAQRHDDQADPLPD